MLHSNNVRTALICNPVKDNFVDCSLFLFKAAFNLAKKGFSTCIFTTSLDYEYEISDEYLLHPEVLQRVHFRYLKSSQDIFNWCQNVHRLHKKPFVLLIPLDKFSNSEDFKIINICAALVDVLMYFSKIDKSKQFYLLATASIDLNVYLSEVHSFFQISWLYTKVNSYVLLKPFFDKDSPCQIVIDGSLDFKDIMEIFNGCHAKM